MMSQIKELKCSITIFGAISLLLIISLLFSLTEMCRMRVSKLYMQIVSNSAIDSLFSMYHRDLWDKYHIFGLESFDDDILKKEYENFLNINIKDNNDYVNNFFIGSINENDINFIKEEIVDKTYFEDEILSYMKYAIINSVIKFNGDIYNINDENDKELLLNTINDMSKQHDNSKIYQRLYNKYFDYNDDIVSLEKFAKNAISNMKEYNDTIKNISFTNAKNKETAEHNYEKIIKIEKDLHGIIDNLNSFIEKMYVFRDVVKANRDKYNIEKVLYEDLDEEVDRFILEEFEYFVSYVDENSEINIKVSDLINVSSSIYDYLSNYIGNFKRIYNEIISLEKELKEISKDKDMTSEEKSEAKKEIKDELEDIYSELKDICDSICDDKDTLIIEDIVLPISDSSDFNKVSAFDKIKNFIDEGFLSLCLDKEEIDRLSNEYIRYDDYSLDSNDKIIDKILLSEYELNFFNFYNKDKYDMNTLSESINFEVETMISGKNTNKDSLSNVINKILLIREGCNVSFLYANQSKRSIARNFAYTMFAPFSIIVKEAMFIVILSTWALCQSFVDTYNILHEKKVPFIHNEDTFSFSIDNILNLSIDIVKNEGNENENGLNYVDYLRLLLITSKQENINSRMISIIQNNISKNQKNFSVNNLIYSINASNVFHCKHFFTNMVFYTPKYTKIFDDYKMKINTYYDYIE